MHSPEPLTPELAAKRAAAWVRSHPVIVASVVGVLSIYLLALLLYMVWPSPAEKDGAWSRTSLAKDTTSAAAPAAQPKPNPNAGGTPASASATRPQIDVSPAGAAPAPPPEPTQPPPDSADARAAGVQTLTLGGPGGQNAPLPSGMKRLRVWYGGPYLNRATVERRLAEFAQQNSLGLEVTFIPETADYPARLEQALEVAPAHAFAPDVFLLDATYAERLTQGGRLAMLPVPGVETANWLPWAALPFSRGASMVAYPCDFSVLVLYYNRSLFDRAGQAPPDTHWDWQMWVSLCSMLQNRLGKVPPSANPAAPAPATPLQIVGIEFPLRADFLATLSAQAEGPLYSGGEWMLGQDPYRTGQLSALRMLQVMVEERFAVTRPGDPPGARFMAGQAATLVGGAEMLPALRNQRTIRWGISLLPRYTQAVSNVEVRGWASSSHSTLPKESADLALWMSATAAGEERLSARAGSPEVRGPETPLFDAAAGMCQPLPNLKEWPVYARTMTQLLAALPKDGAWEEADVLDSLAKATGVRPELLPPPTASPSLLNHGVPSAPSPSAANPAGAGSQPFPGTVR